MSSNPQQTAPKDDTRRVAGVIVTHGHLAGELLAAAEMINIVLKGKGDDMDGFEKELGADMSRKLVEYMQALAKQ